MAKIKRKTREDIEDVNKVVNSYENDSDAIRHLQDIIGDEYPEIDLTKMDLHEAVDVFDELRGNQKKQGNKAKVEDLMSELDNFISLSKKPSKTTKKKRKKKKGARK